MQETSKGDEKAQKTRLKEKRMKKKRSIRERDGHFVGSEDENEDQGVQMESGSVSEEEAEESSEPEIVEKKKSHKKRKTSS